MTFPERAVANCVLAMKEGRVSPRHVRAVLGCRKVDVTSIEPFLKSEDYFVRREAVKIIGEKGRVEALIELAKEESDKLVLMRILECVVKRKEGIDDLICLLDSDDEMVRECAIKAFRKTGNTDSLIGVLLSSDGQEMEDRIRRYMEEGDEEEAG